MVGNFRELGEPGLFGLRGSYEIAGLRFGAGYVRDGNQYASYRDADDHGVPDYSDATEAVQPWRVLTIPAEYRDHTDEFVMSYFDRTYEIERTTTMLDQTGTLQLVPRSLRLLANSVAARGYFADLNLDLWNLVTVYGAYSSMTPKDDDEAPDVRSLSARGRLNVDRVPKISDLSAYYQQSNVEKLFDVESESTLYGLRIGYEMAPGVNLFMKYRWTF
jgi:hypothetical protein